MQRNAQVRQQRNITNREPADVSPPAAGGMDPTGEDSSRTTLMRQKGGPEPHKQQQKASSFNISDIIDNDMSYSPSSKVAIFNRRKSSNASPQERMSAAALP